MRDIECRWRIENTHENDEAPCKTGRPGFKQYKKKNVWFWFISKCGRGIRSHKFVSRIQFSKIVWARGETKTISNQIIKWNEHHLYNTHCSATVAAATATRYGKLTSPESTQQRDILDAQPNKLPMAAFVGLQIGRHKFHFFLWFLLTLPTFYWHRKCFEFRAFLVQIRDQVLLCQCDNSIVTMPQCGDMTPFGLAECQNIVVICHSAFHHRRHQRQKTIVRINRITLHRRFIIVDSSQSLCRLQTIDTLSLMDGSCTTQCIRQSIPFYFFIHI